MGLCMRQSQTMLPVVPANPFAIVSKSSAAASKTAAATATVTTTGTTNTKPKLAFSIDALVGERQDAGKPPAATRPDSPKAVAAPHEPLELRNVCFRVQQLSPSQVRGSVIHSGHERDTSSPGLECSSASRDRTHLSPTHENVQPRSRSSTPMHSPRETTSPEESRPYKVHTNLLPGLIRPFPLQPPASISGIRAGDPNLLVRGPLPPRELQQPPGPGQGPPHSNPHLLAAQFQMAAVLAHHQQQQHQHSAGPHPPQHPGPPAPPHLPPHLVHGHHLGIFPPGPHHPQFGNPHLIRDTYPLYPWLLSRHGRIFSHRFPGFLLQPFRKPKRVRTAFSPTQLLKLEHAFEENHYVVGAERKQLAQNLSLTETQVKVWFQNRRTKHKRMQQEGDSDTKSQKGSQLGEHEGRNDSSQTSFEDQDELDMADGDDLEEDEDEVIDMDDYDEQQLMDAEERKRFSAHFQEVQARHFPHGPIFQPHSQQLLQQHLFQPQSVLHGQQPFTPLERQPPPHPSHPHLAANRDSPEKAQPQLHHHQHQHQQTPAPNH